MRKIIIIKESQAKSLIETISNDAVQANTVSKIKADLDLNYTHETGTYRSGGEYFEKPMIKIKADGEMITPKALYEYLDYKYDASREFLQQIILDWLNGSIKNNLLSKNVSLNA